MSSAIGLSSPTRNQASIPLTQSFQGVQDFSKFDAAELSGYVEAEGSSSFRASVKLSIVKNGAGTYEVAASDIAGDDVSGAPLVSFQMDGSLLEAKIDDGVASFSSAVIKFALISPPNSAGSLSIDASSVVSGTIDSARLPLATASSAGVVPYFEEGTWSASVEATLNLSVVSGQTVTITGLKYLRIGNFVFATIENISGYEITLVGGRSYISLEPTGLPGITNSTQYSGSAHVRLPSPYEPVPAAISASSSNDVRIYIGFNVNTGMGAATGDDLTINSISIMYTID